MIIIFPSLTKIGVLFIYFLSSFQRDNLKVLLKILKIWFELMLRRYGTFSPQKRVHQCNEW